MNWISLTKYLAVVVIIAIVLYIYQESRSPCAKPMSYKIGSIDPRFSLEREEASSVVAEAVTVWETVYEQDLFLSDERSDFTIDFVFDERQKQLNEQAHAKSKLVEMKDEQRNIKERYDSLMREYDSLKSVYDSKLKNYNADLNSYNKKVDEYNEKGEVISEEEWKKIETWRSSIQDQSKDIADLSEKLERMIVDINLISDEGNNLIVEFNERAGEYNKYFGVSREFTQADYKDGKINVYTFANKQELKLVLAHELGHALGIGHVDNPKSIMYFLLGEQSPLVEPTHEDKFALANVCDRNILNI